MGCNSQLTDISGKRFICIELCWVLESHSKLKKKNVEITTDNLSDSNQRHLTVRPYSLFKIILLKSLIMVPSTVMLPHTARSHSPSPADPCTEQVPSLSYPARRERRTQATPLSCPVSVSAFPSILPSQKPTENRRAQPRHQPIQACTMRESPSQSLTCRKCLSLTEHLN